MEESWRFSSRAILVCLKSDPAQPHFIIRKYGHPTTECIICNEKNRSGGYHLYCDTCNSYIHYGCFFKPRCRLSDLTKPHTLEKRFGSLESCFACGRPSWEETWNTSSVFYHCDTCKKTFHDDCHLYPPEINHPFHSLHPLTLTFSSDSSYPSDFIAPKHVPTSLKREDPFGSEANPETDPEDASISDATCNCCQKKLQHIYYHCSVCNFSINLPCTRNPPPLTITNFKSHKHILTLFPRRIHSPCDACGLSLENTHDVVYACVPCNYIVHRTCFYLPRVIMITRHPHRLSLSPSLPSGLFSCGVCRHLINVSYGQFSCQKGCHYALHSKCAMGENVWDGKDLEGVPEEADEDVEPFVRIDDETIQHFSHEHPLNLCKENNVWGKNRFCEACTLPILVSKSSYSCMECNEFILHESCASFPRKKGHPLHKHRLVLHPIPPGPFEFELRILSYGGYENSSRYLKEMFKCNGCDQICCGFVYRCGEEGCNFQLDVRCASLPDPFIHGSHPDHDLFFNLTKGECMGCKSSDCSPYYLECMECKSFMGLKCATLPSVTRYKHDKHPLTLCYGKEETSRGQYWCEICETQLDAKEWFYACDDYCSVTLHVSCLLGKMFLKPTSFLVYDDELLFSIIRNSDNTRAICNDCRRRCVGPFYFQLSYLIHVYFCSLYCSWDYLES